MDIYSIKLTNIHELENTDISVEFLSPYNGYLEVVYLEL